jgi:hypothetical protein
MNPLLLRCGISLRPMSALGSKAAFSLRAAFASCGHADIIKAPSSMPSRASHTSSPGKSNTAKPAVSFRASWSEWLGASRDADVCDPERVWLQPRYRGLAHTIGSRQISLRNALHKPLDNFLALMDGKRRRPAKTHPTGFSAGSTLTGAGPDQLSANDLKPTPRSPSVYRMLSKSRVERASRSSRVTISTSPVSSRLSTLANKF